MRISHIISLFAILTSTPSSAAEWAKLHSLPQDNEQSYAGFTDLWALSDIHGHRELLLQLLSHSGLITLQPKLTWIKKNQLLVVVGDLIDLNEKEAKYSDAVDESAEILRDLSDLQTQATQSNSKVILLLGNHEIDVLAYPDPEDSHHRMEKGFLKSIARVLEVKKSKLTPESLTKSPSWKVMKDMNLGLILGDSLWIHSGLLIPPPDKSVNDLMVQIASASEKSYLPLASDPGLAAPFTAHDWYKAYKKEVRKNLEAVGFATMIVGHEKNLLKDPKLISNLSFDKKGWLLKLDTGVKRGMDGKILHCSFKELKKDAAKDHLVFFDRDHPRCHSQDAQGKMGPVLIAE